MPTESPSIREDEEEQAPEIQVAILTIYSNCLRPALDFGCIDVRWLEVSRK